MFKKLSQDEIARQLLAEAPRGETIQVAFIRDGTVEVKSVQTQDEANRAKEQWATESRARYEREAERLFEKISINLGPEAATEILRGAAAKRRRGPKYTVNLKNAFLYYALRFGPTKTARRANALGLHVDEAALVRHIGRLLEKSGFRKRTNNPLSYCHSDK